MYRNPNDRNRDFDRDDRQPRDDNSRGPREGGFRGPRDDTFRPQRDDTFRPRRDDGFRDQRPGPRAFPGGQQGGAFGPRRDGNRDRRDDRDHPGDDRLIYGLRAVMEAIAAKASIDKVWIHRDLQKAGDLLGALRQADIPFQHVPSEKLDALARGGNHQGVVAIVAPIPYRALNEVLGECADAGKVPVILILDGITDVRNFGAIARSAECMGVSAIVLPVQGSVTVTPDAMKASAGALLHVPVCREGNLKATIILLQHSGVRVVGLSEKGDTPLNEADLSGPLALLMGAEDVGISPALLKLCDSVARIPLGGRIQSLNVSVAAGIALYAAHVAGR